MPLYVQRWKDRDVKPKIKYSYPPPKINPFAVNFDYFRDFLGRFDKKLVAVLASGMGLGPDYAKEVCLRANVDDQIPSERLGANLTVSLFNTIRSLDRVAVVPVIYDDFVSPFPLKSLEGKLPMKEKKTISEALDEFFSEQQIEIAEKIEERTKEEHTEKIEKIIGHQQASIEKWQTKRKEKRSNADIIYSHYGTVEWILDGINKAKDSGMSWEEIKRRVRSENTPEAEAIKEINEHEGTVTVELGGQEITLDFRKSVEENAADYYEGSKHARKKIEGAMEAIEETKKRLEEEPEVEEIAKPVRIEKKKKKWFESFRWFETSSGLLVVGGKDATTNEVLIKKHTEMSDLVFHSDIQGAPFVVIKAGDGEISDDSKKEAAEFAASYSKAWASGLATVDVYAVKPDQVSKQPPSGEYLPKGAFMIYGQREWFRDVELKLSIGVRIDHENDEIEVLSGPVMPMRKHTSYFITIKPGDKPSLELAREIKNKILIKAAPEDKVGIEKLPLDDFQKFIPGGKGEVVEYGV